MLEMAFEFRGAHGIQFLVKVCMKNGLGPVTTHGGPPLGSDLPARIEAGGAHEKAWT